MAHKRTDKEALDLALISDTGGPAASATTFYYNIGSGGKGFVPTNSFGPGPAAVSKLVQSWKPSDLFAIGDLAYNAGGSTLQDISIGQYYNNFAHPYPSTLYLREPYTTINNKMVQEGKKSWPYNVYNFPKGFPSPTDPKQSGGSPDQRNHFWGSLGNHDYGMAIGYGQVGLTPYNFQGDFTGQPIGPSSSTSVKASIDYFLPYLQKPALLGADRKRLRVGSVDTSGNSGAYYAMSFGGTSKKPLIDFFMLDTERLNINAGFEDWNPSGAKQFNPETGLYENAIESNPDFSLTYDPSDPNASALNNSTTDPNNGYAQFSWLKEALQQSKAEWKVITGHHPVYASGRWSDEQPDDHMSNPYLQRLLNALPEGSFDAYYNGHDHYYERVLESKEGGIGLGIPFITNGNSGRNLSKKIQVPYGISVYEPTQYDPETEGNPNTKALPYLLDSAPVETGGSGLAGNGDETENNRFSNGLYGYGFGATRLTTDKDFLLFHYQEAPITDPAIENHLPGGVAPEDGFKGTSPRDWIPNPNGTFRGRSDLAQFKLNITDGTVTGVELLNGGNGYMSSMGGNHTITGFNIYGNNLDALKPWKGTAQVDLDFTNGALTSVRLTDGGRAYELAVQSAADNNTTTSTESLDKSQYIVVAINYNLSEIQYLVRDESLYNDWHLTTDSKAVVKLMGQSGDPGSIQVKVGAASKKARQLLRQELDPTTGYSGSGHQSFSPWAQDGDFIIYHRGKMIAQGNLDDGTWTGQVDQLPKSTDRLVVDFAGDPITSYNVNFRPSKAAARVARSSRSASEERESYAFASSPQLVSSGWSSDQVGGENQPLGMLPGLMQSHNQLNRAEFGSGI